MRSALLPLAFPILTGAIAQQPASYELVPSDPVVWQVPMDLGGGNTCYAIHHPFSNDSTRFELMWTAPDKMITHAAAYRMMSPAFVYLMDAAHLTSGIVMTGYNSGGPVWAQIMAVDNLGAVLWAKTLTNVYRQRQTAGLVIPRGDLFTLYGQGSGANYDGFARVEADISGTAWSGINMQPPDSVQYELYSAFPTSIPGVHIAYGSGIHWNDMPNWKTVVMETSDTGAVWMKMYTMPPEHTVPNDPYDMRPTSDGNYICSGGYRENGWLDNRGYLMKLDPTGDVLWCRVYADTSGYFTMNTVVELPGGDLLAAGQGYSNTCVLLRIAPDGAMVWQERLDLPDSTWNTVGRFAVSTSGELALGIRNRLIGLSPEGETCGLVAYDGVTDSLFTPTVTPVDLTNVPFAPTMVALDVEPRTPGLAWQETCAYNAVEETGARDLLRAFPNPTDGSVVLDDVDANERIIVRSIHGALLQDGVHGAAVHLEGRAPGCYVVEVPGRGRRALIVKR